MRAQFIRGLRPNICRFVMTHNPLSLADTIDVAVNEELNDMQLKDRQHSIYMLRTDPPRDEVNRHRDNIPARTESREVREERPRVRFRQSESNAREGGGSKPTFDNSLKAPSYYGLPREQPYNNSAPDQTVKNPPRIPWREDLPPERVRTTPMDDRNSQVRCYRCDGIGHFARQCGTSVTRSPIPNTKRVTCYFCSEPGHIAPHCPQRDNRSENRKLFPNEPQLGKKRI
jgi:Zinc knuckle